MIQREQDHEQDESRSPVCTYEDFSSSKFQISNSTQAPELPIQLSHNQALTLIVDGVQRQENDSVIGIIQINPDESYAVLETKQEKDTLEYRLGDDSDVYTRG